MTDALTTIVTAIVVSAILRAVFQRQVWPSKLSELVQDKQDHQDKPDT